MRLLRFSRKSPQHKEIITMKTATTAKRRFPNAAWITGNGPWASLAYCKVLTVCLYATREQAHAARAFIDQTGCGGGCYGDHRVINIEEPAPVGKFPTVTPIRIEPNPSYPGAVLVVVLCPHCGREHTHGGYPDDYAGHRASHCHSPIGYVIEEATRRPKRTRRDPEEPTA